MGRDKIKSSVVLPVLISCYVLMLFTPGRIQGQGLILEEDAETRLAYNFKAGSKGMIDGLKGVYKIDLRPYAPPPQNQGVISSCTGWAAGYGALTIMRAVKQNWKDSTEKIKNNAFSALFIYNQIWKGGCEYGGSNIQDAGKLLVEKGNVGSKEFDRLKNRCDRLPNEEELKLATRSRIQEFAKVFSPDEPALNKIEKTKLSLVKKLPVVIGINLRKNFKEIRSKEIFWRPQFGDTTFFCAHAMVVIGFDDDKQAFEVMNSWGTEWANGGFVWIKYTDFAEYARHAYHFVPYQYNIPDHEIEINVELDQPQLDAAGVLSFYPVPAVIMSNCFTPVHPMQSGDFLRLKVYSSKSPVYLYCFSIDARKKVNLHWPRDILLDQKFTSDHNLGSITTSNTSVYIPGEFRALSFETSGDEYVFILVSAHPILKINENLQALKNLSFSNPFTALQKVFGKQIVSYDKMDKGLDRIKVNTEYSNKMILPIVIKLDLI